MPFGCTRGATVAERLARTFLYARNILRKEVLSDETQLTVIDVLHGIGGDAVDK